MSFPSDKPTLRAAPLWLSAAALLLAAAEPVWAGPFPRGGRWIYRIKWLTPDRRVLIVIADAQTGQILDVR